MKKILSIILSISMTLGLFVSPVFANESDVTSEPAVSTESSQLEVNGEDSAGQMIADAITEQAAEQNPDSTCSISSLTIDKASMTAEVSFVTDEDAELLVSIFSEDRKTLKASGRQQVTTAEHNATIPISCRVADSSLPDTFVGEAYLLDKDTHAPLCDSFVTNEYTKEITDLKKSTINDFEADRVLNLDNDTETNFAVYNDGVNVIEETSGKNQITDNGDGTYTVTNADSTFTSLKSGDKLSYTDSDGNVLLLTVAKITVNGSTVTIWKETKEEDLTDYFAYLKIETTDQNGALDIDKSTMDEGVTFLGSDLETQSETAAVGASGEGSLSHSLSFQIKEKLASSEDAAKSLDVNAEVKIQLNTTLKYYLSGSYQELLFKMEYSVGVSAGMTGKMEKKYRLVRVELPVLPGINVGFTPSFVVRATGNTKWTGEWKGIIGFAYDTTNGSWDPGEAPTTTSKVEINATLFVGVEATPYVCIMTEDLCKASLETSAGIELKGTQSKDSDETKIHKCDECTAGSVKCKVSAKLKLEVVKSTATVEANLVSLEVKLFDFYYSRTYNEFGYDSCPHIYYKTKLSLKDKKGQAVPDAWITPMKIGDNGPAAVKFLVDKEKPETTSVAAGTDGTSVIYLPKGKYVLHAKTDDLIGEKTAEIKKRANYTHEVNMTMNTRTYPVTVTVQDESGNPVSGASFEEKNPETGKTISVDGKTNAKGQAALQLALGTHTLEARTATSKGSGEITVTKDTNALTITMAEIKYGTVNLTAVDGEGNAVAGASISGANLSAFLVTDSSGKSSFKAEVGPLAIHVKKDKASGDAELDVKEGEQDVTVVLADFYTLTVHAVDTNGNPVENAVVSGLNKVIEPRTDANGMAEMTIPEGKQCIQVYTDTMFGYKDLEVTDADVEVTVTLENSKFFWTLNGGELRIFGEGEMPWYSRLNAANNDMAPWSQYLVKNAIIEEGITSIGVNAFYDNKNLVNVNIANTVTKVWTNAFEDCSSLKSIILPESITTIEMFAFRECSSLKNIRIPDSVTLIEDGAFKGCSSLTSIVLPDKLTYLHALFDGCSSLESVTIPDTVKNIGGGAFNGCSSLTSIVIPEGVTTIRSGTFKGCSSLKSIMLPDTVTSIGQAAFEYCSSLKSIKLPEGLTKIWDWAFIGCSSLENVFIPDSVTECCYYVFRDCTNLKSISAPATMLVYDNTFYGCNATITWRTVASSAGAAFSDSPDDESIEITPEEASSENVDQPEVVFDDEYIEDGAEDDPSADVDIISETDDEAGSDTINEFADGAEAAEEVTTVLEKNITEDQSAVISDPWTQRTENNLVPGEKYILIWARKENEDVSLSANDVYYTQQKTADEQGTIRFKYPMIAFIGGSVPQIFIFGPSTENNLIDAEVQIASLTEGANWQSPEIQVSYKGKVLTEDTDYRVYGDTYVKEAGEYSVLIKGCGDYNGRIRVGYTVKAAEKPSEKPSEPDKPNPSEPETPADHTHKYRVTYRWQNVSDEEKKCMITWNCTVENCSHRIVTDATVTRSGNSCTGYSYQATGVLDGVTYTNTYKTLGSGHSWTSWQTVSAATVTQPEKQTRRCQNCGTIANRNNGSALKPTMKINASSFPMKVKQTTTKLKVTGLAAGDRVVSWTSSNPKILTVNKNGKLKAGKKTGKVTVTVRLASGLTKQVRITVQKKTVKTTKISLSPAKITLKKGKKQTLKPVITPITSQQKTTYSSNNKKVVSVNSKGQITAKKKGTAKITIRSGNKKKVVTVTVK